MRHIVSMVCILLTNSILPCTCVSLAYLGCYTMAGFALAGSIFCFTPFRTIRIENSDKTSSKEPGKKLAIQREE